MGHNNLFCHAVVTIYFSCFFQNGFLFGFKTVALLIFAVYSFTTTHVSLSSFCDLFWLSLSIPLSKKKICSLELIAALLHEVHAFLEMFDFEHLIRVNSQMECINTSKGILYPSVCSQCRAQFKSTLNCNHQILIDLAFILEQANAHKQI